MRGRILKLRPALAVWAGLAMIGRSLAGDQTPEGRVHYQPAPETGQPAWIAPISERDSVLRFKATVSGRAVEAMADTGATFTALDRRFAETLGAKVAAAQAIPIVGIGGPASAYPGPTIDLTFPSYAIENLSTVIVDLAALRAVAGHPIDMALGLDFLGSGALELDMAGDGWRMWPSGIQWPDAATAPLRRSDSGFHAFVTVAIEDRPLRLWIDTGSTEGLHLTAAAAGAIEGLKQGRRTTLATQGINGVAVASLVIPTRLRFGGVEVSEVPVQFGEGETDAQPEGFDGKIGLGLLRRLHAVMDFPAGTFFYAAETRATKPLERSTIGLQTQWENGGVLVRHVMANSPAAAAGWKDGDRICAIDGVPVAEPGAGQSANSWGVKPPGTRLTFRLCDGTERSLIAQDFY